jgi:hypothetical protein
MALGSTQPLTEMRPGIFLGVKESRRVRLTTSPPSVSLLYRKIWAPRHLTTLWAYLFSETGANEEKGKMVKEIVQMIQENCRISDKKKKKLTSSCQDVD